MGGPSDRSAWWKFGANPNGGYEVVRADWSLTFSDWQSVLWLIVLFSSAHRQNYLGYCVGGGGLSIVCARLCHCSPHVSVSLSLSLSQGIFVEAMVASNVARKRCNQSPAWCVRFLVLSYPLAQEKNTFIIFPPSSIPFTVALKQTHKINDCRRCSFCLATFFGRETTRSESVVGGRKTRKSVVSMRVDLVAESSNVWCITSSQHPGFFPPFLHSVSHSFAHEHAVLSPTSHVHDGGMCFLTRWHFPEKWP